MDRIAQLDAIVRQFELNNHPFYADWRKGCLPVEKLRVYAREYGRFVATIASGWETLGFDHYADEEREHEALWAHFQSSLNSAAGPAQPQTDALVGCARSLFSVKPAAAGALYAFEAQQPHTSATKLDGLNEHYDVSDAGKEYFRVHANDFAEAEDLRRVVLAMSDAEFEQTRAACAVVCSAMWTALDGVYYAAA
jgi:pyrroloquinoline-quinone synthase